MNMLGKKQQWQGLKACSSNCSDSNGTGRVSSDSNIWVDKDLFYVMLPYFFMWLDSPRPSTNFFIWRFRITLFLELTILCSWVLSSEIQDLCKVSHCHSQLIKTDCRDFIHVFS